MLFVIVNLRVIVVLSHRSNGVYYQDSSFFSCPPDQTRLPSHFLSKRTSKWSFFRLEHCNQVLYSRFVLTIKTMNYQFVI